MKKFGTKIIVLPLFKWILFYIVLNLIWFLLPNNLFSLSDLLRNIFYIIFLIFFTLFLFLIDDLIFLRGLLAILVIIASINNIIDFIYPIFFNYHYVLTNFGVLGRGAGLYINPNISASSILLGIIFSITIIPEKYRNLFLLITFIGILVTFSRAAIISYFIIIFLLAYFRIVSIKKTVIIIFMIIYLMIFFYKDIFDFLYDGEQNILMNIENRILWFLDPSNHIDFSEKERKEVLNFALNIFENNPFMGGGLGSTIYWQYRVSTHNIYVALLANFGIIGFLIYPLLLWSTIKESKGDIKTIGIIFFVFSIFWGLFSHNVLDEYNFLISYAMMSYMSFKSKIGFNHAKNNISN